MLHDLRKAAADVNQRLLAFFRRDKGEIFYEA